MQYQQIPFYKKIYYKIIRFDYTFYNFRNGIRNVIRWTPVIWGDVDYDWESLAIVMQVKMRWMSAHFKEANIVYGSEEIARELSICAEAIERMRDSKSKNWYQQEDECQQLLGKILGRKFRCWWD